MKKNFLRALAALLCAATLFCASCTAPAAPADPVDSTSAAGSGQSLAGFRLLTSGSFTPSASTHAVPEEFSLSYADLALELLRACEKDASGTAMVSPLSVLTALAMTANGAKGSTLAQMLSVLGFSDPETMNRELSNFYATLTSTDSASFHSANSVWMATRDTLHVNPDFIRLIDKTYDADIAAVDFSDPATAADAINAWVSQKTKEMIPGIVDDNSLSKYTAMVLVNALCFDAKWAVPFDSEYACREAVFRGRDKNRTVRMMYGNEYQYIKGNGATGFIKPYEGGRYAFAAFLPDADSSVEKLLASLDAAALLSLINGAQNTQVNIAMPAFSADYDKSLVDQFKALGMTDAFDVLLADFSGLATEDDANIYIGNILHKTHIDVDNEGTRAAAVTAVIMEPESAVPDLPKSVILDRPFVYAIIDTATGLPIFFGTCE